ncbi:MAG: hypothetical protein U0263_39640 [Polyangiaceae bacterium]
MNQLPPLPELGPVPSGVSVTEPVSAAIAHTRRMLFPFDAAKWLTLGFVAWLAHWGEGGASSFQLPDPGGKGGGSGLGPAVQWVRDHLSTVMLVGLFALLVGIGVGALVTWVSSRAKLMFVHAIVRDEARVEEPWRRFRERGKDLFLARLVLGLIGLGFLLAGAGVMLVLAWPELERGTIGRGFAIAAIAGTSLLLVGMLPLAVVNALIEDFVVVAMYKFDEPVRPAFRRVRAGILRGNLGPIVLFYLMRFVIGIVLALITGVLTCLTCCFAALPYIGSVILLPVLVFDRAYVLFFVEQFGDEWRLFPRPETSAFDPGFAPP